MCKLLMMAGITNETREKAIELVVEMSGIIGENMRDGIGYAAVTEEGNLFGERWHNSEEAFDVREPSSEKDAIENSIIESFGDALILESGCSKYNSFGDKDESIDDLMGSMTAITLHGRYATSGKQFENTHPFVSDDTSLVHNGVIRNAIALNLNTQSSCDSEVILNLYNKKKVNRWISNIQGVVDELEGYYACGIFTRDKSGNRVLDIIKDDTAKLFAAYIKELKTLVFVTNLKDLEKACELIQLTITSTFTVESDKLIRINPVTGTVIQTEDFCKLDTYKWENISEKLKRKDIESFDVDKVLGL